MSIIGGFLSIISPVYSAFINCLVHSQSFRYYGCLQAEWLLQHVLFSTTGQQVSLDFVHVRRSSYEKSTTYVLFAMHSV